MEKVHSKVAKITKMSGGKGQQIRAAEDIFSEPRKIFAKCKRYWTSRKNIEKREVEMQKYGNEGDFFVTEGAFSLTAGTVFSKRGRNFDKKKKISDFEKIDREKRCGFVVAIIA